MPIEQIPHTVDTFDKYGLPGLVILVLFGLVFYILSRIQIIIKSSDDRFDKQSNLHAEERKEVTVVVRDLSKVIQTLSAQFEGKNCLSSK